MIGGIGAIASLVQALDRSARLGSSVPRGLTQAVTVEVARETAQLDRAVLRSALRVSAQLPKLLDTERTSFDPQAPRGTYLDMMA
jgi:hypothetical protein